MCRLPGFLSLILSQDFTVSHCECVTERAGFHESCRNLQLNLTCIDTRQLSSSSLAAAGFFQQRLIVLQRRVCACSCWALGPLWGLLRNESRQSISNRTPDLSTASETYGVTHTHTHTQRQGQTGCRSGHLSSDLQSFSTNSVSSGKQ